MIAKELTRMNQAAAPTKLTVTGRLREKAADRIVLDIPHTDYRLHLAVDRAPAAAEGERLTGSIHAQAKRVDPIRSGGRFIEPNYGRPRRVQGTIIGGDLEANQLHVHCGGAPIIATLMPAQRAADFAIGQMVLFDVERGAKFDPVA